MFSCCLKCRKRKFSKHKNLQLHINISKEIITFGEIENEKKKFSR